MKVKLQTWCGCEKEMELPESAIPRGVRIPMMVGNPLLNKSAKRLNRIFMFKQMENGVPVFVESETVEL